MKQCLCKPKARNENGETETQIFRIVHRYVYHYVGLMERYCREVTFGSNNWYILSIG